MATSKWTAETRYRVELELTRDEVLFLRRLLYDISNGHRTLSDPLPSELAHELYSAFLIPETTKEPL